jgi:hypothetical protein
MCKVQIKQSEEGKDQRDMEGMMVDWSRRPGVSVSESVGEWDEMSEPGS